MTEEIFKTKIKDIELKYSVEYRKVKRIRYLIKDDYLKLVIPKGIKKSADECIKLKEKWLYNSLIKNIKLNEELEEKSKDILLFDRSLDELKNIASYYFLKYEKMLNVKVNKLQYRDMVHKWGSCSSLKNITLAKQLKFVPDELIAYIVYHELAHLIVMNHGDDFFKIIKREFPKYKIYDDKLEIYDYLIRKN